MTKQKTAPTINEKIQKLFHFDVKSINEEKRTVEFCFSDDSIDRYGEIVDQASWDVKRYKQNPVILWGHDPSQAENVIGSGMDIRLNEGGKSFITAQFDDDEKASLIFNKIKKGILRTVSAGFIPHTLEWNDDVPVLKDNELLEVSVVAIPANPNALVLDYKAGELKEKDAAYLVKSMREEADRLEAAQKAAESADDPKTEEELRQALEDAEKRAEEAEARAEKAEADLAEATKEETEESEEEDDNPEANDGEDDQSGAEETDEIDVDGIELDDELTPEQEQAIDEALAKALNKT